MAFLIKRGEEIKMNAARLTLFRRLLFTTFLFTVVFMAWEIQLRELLILVDVLLFAAEILYGRTEKGFFGRLLTDGVGCALGYLIARIVQGRELRMLTWSEGCLCAVGILLWIFSVWQSCHLKEIVPEKLELFPEQEYDKKRLVGYIQTFPLVGIHARWGNGKSILWNAIRQENDITEEFEVIQIDLLACNLDEIERILLRELEKLLEKHRIYPENSRYLKNQLGRIGVLERLEVLIDEMSFSDAFHALAKELDRLPKKVLVNFEDIDRIKNEEVVKKIFAIAEKLSSERFHVVFQYNRDLLPGSLREKDYLEKYVPYNVELTPIAFSALVERFWTILEMKKTQLKIEDLTMLGVTRPATASIGAELGIELKPRLELEEQVSIRKVKAYLKELKQLLTENPELDKKENACTIAMALFLKHFYLEAYESLRVGVSPLEKFYFIDEDRRCTLFQLVEKYKQTRYDPQKETKGAYEEREKKRREALQKLFSEEHEQEKEKDVRIANGQALLYLALLGYEMPKGTTAQKTKAKNDKIDHLVWNVIASGGPELTNAENEVQQLQEKVFSKRQEQWLNAWEEYQLDRFYGRFPKNNTTVMMFGDDPLVSSFRAMQTAGAFSSVQTQLLVLLEQVCQKSEKPGTITDMVLGCLVCCDWNHGRDLRRMAAFFSGLNVEGNPSALEVYRRFFGNAMSAISWQGYDGRQDGWRFMHIEEENFCELAQSEADWLKARLEEKRKKQKLTYLQQELEVLISFVAKNKTLLQCNTPLRQHKPGWKIKQERSEYIHQKEMDRLVHLRQEDAQTFEEELKKSWLDGNLYYAEIENVLCTDTATVK